MKKMILVILSTAILMAVITIDMENRIHTLEEEKDNLKSEGENKDCKIDSLRSELDSLHSLTWDNIDYFLQVYNVRHPDIVKRQIELETANLTSVICLENKNLFGMKHPRVRLTTSLGTNRGHAYYNNYIESIKDYALWQQSMYSEGNYYTFLVNIGYAEASHYTQVLRNL